MSENSNTNLSAATAPDDSSILAERRNKLAQWRSSNQAYPNDFKRLHYANDLLVAYNQFDRETLEATGHKVQIAGRIMLKRVMGKAAFLTVQDQSGRLQAYIALDAIGEEQLAEVKQWDLGDIIGVSGTLFKTKVGELTVHVTSIRLLSKCLRPLPEKFHGLADQETCYRQRYLDLITNEDSRDVFLTRSKLIMAIREYMHNNNFLEVETPMMHQIPGGAAAKPFITYHNALDQQMFLRISPELYLKRLIVGGFERVFEINRNFRNEGLSPRHNPEFTMMEFYEAYADYNDIMTFTENIIRHAADKSIGRQTFIYQERELDFTQPFARQTIADAVLHYNPQYQKEQLLDAAWLKQELLAAKQTVREDQGLGALQLMFFELTTEDKLWQPTFIIDYPAEVSPLARLKNGHTDLTDRFELFITGREIANGFSELNDPDDQATRFNAQVAAKKAGDDEAMFYDADYILALEHGMPPTGGCGIGIDRLVMLLTNSSAIRDVILFPQMRRS